MKQTNIRLLCSIEKKENFDFGPVSHFISAVMPILMFMRIPCRYSEKPVFYRQFLGGWPDSFLDVSRDSPYMFFA